MDPFAYAACVVALLAAVVPPALSFALFCRRREGLVKPFLFGMLTFTLFQVALRIPLLQYWVPYQLWFITGVQPYPVWNAVFLGVTASLFEELGRFLVMLLFLRKRRRWIDGVAFGFGHAGIEAILLVGVNLAAILFVGILPEGVTAATLLLMGAERLIVLPMHIAFSVMVAQCIALKRPKYFLYALILHAAVDIFAALAALYALPTPMLECTLLLIGLLLAAYCLSARTTFPPVAAAPSRQSARGSAAAAEMPEETEAMEEIDEEEPAL